MHHVLPYRFLKSCYTSINIWPSYDSPLRAFKHRQNVCWFLATSWAKPKKSHVFDEKTELISTFKITYSSNSFFYHHLMARFLSRVLPEKGLIKSSSTFAHLIAKFQILTLHCLLTRKSCIHLRRPIIVLSLKTPNLSWCFRDRLFGRTDGRTDGCPFKFRTCGGPVYQTGVPGINERDRITT